MKTVESSCVDRKIILVLLRYQRCQDATKMKILVLLPIFFTLTATAKGNDCKDHKLYGHIHCVQGCPGIDVLRKGAEIMTGALKDQILKQIELRKCGENLNKFCCDQTQETIRKFQIAPRSGRFS